MSARWRKKRRRDSCDEEVREEEEEETNLIESTELAAADGPRDRKRVSDMYVCAPHCAEIRSWIIGLC